MRSGHAWGKTQHARGEWTETDGVTLAADPEAVRSSCIGDVLVVCEAGEAADANRQAYQVDFGGFSKIDERRPAGDAPDHPTW